MYILLISFSPYMMVRVTFRVETTFVLCLHLNFEMWQKCEKQHLQKVFVDGENAEHEFFKTMMGMHSTNEVPKTDFIVQTLRR